MTDLSERLTHLADQHANTPSSVTFADVTAARARQRRVSALLTGAVLATAAISAFVLLRPTPGITAADPSATSSGPVPSSAPAPSTWSVASADVPVPQRVLDGLAAITNPTLSHGPRGAVAWLRTDARTAASFWPEATRPRNPFAETPDAEVLVVAVSVANWVCPSNESCVRPDGFMVGIVAVAPGGPIAPMTVLDVPRSFAAHAGLHRFSVTGFPTGFPTGIPDSVTARVLADPAAGNLAWAQWQQTTSGQYTLHMYGHYVCGFCSAGPEDRAPEGDMVTITRAADGSRSYTVGGNAAEDLTIAPDFTAVFLPPIAPAAPTPGTTTPTVNSAEPVVVNHFGLGTHCGPVSLVYNGQYYANVAGAAHRFDPSWDPAVTDGTLTVTGDMAVFTDGNGHHETFEVAVPPTGANCR